MKQLLICLLLFFSCLLTRAQNIDTLISHPTGRMVVDLAGSLSPEEKDTLETKLIEFDKKTSTQLAVVLIDTLQGRDLESTANQLFNSWGIGQKDKNNGILIFAAMRDRKIRIELGLGFADKIRDEECAAIIQNDIVPHFKNQQYYRGLTRAVESLMRLAEKIFPAIK